MDILSFIEQGSALQVFGIPLILIVLGIFIFKKVNKLRIVGIILMVIGLFILCFALYLLYFIGFSSWSVANLN